MCESLRVGTCMFFLRIFCVLLVRGPRGDPMKRAACTSPLQKVKMENRGTETSRVFPSESVHFLRLHFLLLLGGARKMARFRWNDVNFVVALLCRYRLFGYQKKPPRPVYGTEARFFFHFSPLSMSTIICGIFRSR